MKFRDVDELAQGADGVILHDITGVEYDRRLKKIYDKDGDGYLISDVKLIEIKDGMLYIIPIANLDDYIKDGLVLKDFPNVLKIENWSWKPVRERAKLRSKIFKEIDMFEDGEDGLIAIDRILTINPDDSEIIKKFKETCNKLKIRAHRDSVQWVKSALREVESGTISSKSLEQLIKQMKLKYSVSFYREV